MKKYDFDGMMDVIMARGIRKAADRLLILSDSPEVPHDSALESHMELCVDIYRAYADNMTKAEPHQARYNWIHDDMVSWFVGQTVERREQYIKNHWDNVDNEDVRSHVEKGLDKIVLTPDGVGRMIGISTESNGLHVQDHTTKVQVWYGVDDAQNGWTRREFHMREVIPSD
jgi:hypothetical protein